MCVQQKKGNENCRTGLNFTLIELLIVISIIAILASMLLPALNRVRKMAQSTDCLSRIKQAGIAITGYINDFRDNYPPSYYGTGGSEGGSTTWVDLMADSLKMYRRHPLNPTGAYYNPSNPFHFKKKHNLECPSMQLQDGNRGYLTSVAYSLNQLMSGGVGRFTKISIIAQPSNHLTNVCAWAETNTFSMDSRRRGPSSTGIDFLLQIALRHNKKSSALYLDGHAVLEGELWLRRGRSENYPFNRGSTGPSNLPWAFNSGMAILTNFAPFD